MAVITPLGVDRLRAASKTHLEGVRHYFLDVIPQADQNVIERSLNMVAGGLTGKVLAPDSVCSSRAAEA